MKKLAMVLALAFTMGLAASTVSASNDDAKKDKKAKTECTKEQKAECKTEKKACCAEKKAEKK